MTVRRSLQSWLSWFPWYRRRAREAELERELRDHLDLEAEEQRAAGLSQKEAAHAAHLALGNTLKIEEDVRVAWGFQRFETFVQDLRYALRMLRKSPGFTIAAVLTLALGIGLNSSIFALFDATVLRPLPAKDPSTVVDVYQGVVGDFGSYRSFSYPEYVALRNFNSVFSGLVAYSWIPVELNVASHGTAAGDTEEAHGLLVSGNYFSVLGDETALGRTFAPEEAATSPVIVLSQAFWEQRFRSDPAAVGKIVRLNGISLTVVGIAREDFTGTESQAPDFWVPLMMQPQLMPSDSGLLRDRSSFWLDVVARLRPGVTRKQAAANMDVLANRLSEDYLGGRRTAITVTPGSFLSRPDERGQLDSLAFLVLGAVSMILLIACVNVAALLLARAAGRQKEISIRLSLGASRRRLIQQLLTESSVIAILSGGVGLLLARWMPNFLIDVLQPPDQVPITLHVGLDITVLGYTLLLSIATGLVFGLAPALQASKPNLSSVIKDESTYFGQRISRSRLYDLLVAAETSASLVLLLCAGLLLRALQKAQTVNLGFDAKHVLVVSLDLDLRGYDDTRAAEFNSRLTQRLQALPGVKSVSLASLAPLGGTSRSASITVPGREASVDLPSHLFDYWVVSPNYFSTLGVPIVQGRNFSVQDTRGGPPVAIINQAMARQVWAGQNPVGKLFRLGPPTVPFTEIVGVVKDTTGARLWEEGEPYVYLPLLQTEKGPYVQTAQLGMKLLIRAAVNPDMIAALVPRIVKSLDPNVQVSARTLSQSLGRWLWFSQAGATLASAIGILALLLAAMGIYGVMSYSVGQRTHEIGIRMALGAHPRDILRLVVGQGLRITLYGVALGLVVALGVTRTIAAMLYRVKPTDPISFGSVSILLLGVALLACYIPARRAMRVDPMVALRYE
jgi:macrolide transport system ATP-binding/permease protein